MMSIEYPNAPGSKKFNGQTYTLHGTIPEPSKQKAEDYAKTLRKFGNYVRVVGIDGYYHLYVCKHEEPVTPHERIIQGLSSEELETMDDF